MINLIKNKLISEKRLTKDLMKIIYDVKSTPKTNHIKLSDIDFQYACYALHIKPSECFTRIKNIMIFNEHLKKADAQRIAVIAEMCYRYDTDRRDISILLSDKRALGNLARQGEAIYFKKQKWRDEYPGTSEWIKTINIEMKGKGNDKNIF